MLKSPVYCTSNGFLTFKMVVKSNKKALGLAVEIFECEGRYVEITIQVH